MTPKNKNMKISIRSITGIEGIQILKPESKADRSKRLVSGKTKLTAENTQKKVA